MKNAIGRETQQQTLTYVKWWLENDISDTSIRDLMWQQAQKETIAARLTQVYVDMTALFLDGVHALRQNPNEFDDFQAARMPEVATLANNDVAVVRLFRLHMIDKILELPKHQAHLAGNIKPDELTSIQRFLGAWKLNYLNNHPKKRETQIF